ncbi:arginine repressor [Weissella tructae]|jgi:transcriptional regulator of arginine metabolism|uniref:Arginine repressor n=2 Tax=Weissella TaxID=46255 RepID=A0A075U6H4_9LACO|nr:Arginine repressor [Weissella tructae]AIM63126.1 Arginine repressor [Weissella ceti]AIM64462.1 Arginine repressor [Weissella ceti]ELA06800.1 arginine repressor [Weissella ceti NC36]
MTMKKTERQNHILQIITAQTIETQDMLMAALEAVGVQTTQATVSRDIKELHIVRQPDQNGTSRYQTLRMQPENNLAVLQRLFEQSVHQIVRVDFMTILKTSKGNGNRIAASIDAAQLSEVVATLAGHDTIYVTSPSSDEAKKLTERFNRWL